MVVVLARTTDAWISAKSRVEGKKVLTNYSFVSPLYGELRRRAAIVVKSQGSGKLLYVLPKHDYFSKGRRGSVSHALGVARGLADNGVDIHMISGPGLTNFAADLGPSIRIDEVAVNGPNHLWVWALARRVRELVLSDPAISAVIVRYAVGNAAVFGKLMRTMPDRQWVFEVNSLAFHQYGWLPRPLRALARRWELKILRSSAAVYVVSEGLRSDLVDGTNGLHGDRVIVAPNAASAGLLVNRRTPRRGECANVPVVFRYLGIFQPYYDFNAIVDAFVSISEEFPSAEMHLHGDGPALKSLEERSLGSNRIFLRGRYDLQSLIANGELEAGTVLLLPYRDIPIARIGSPTKLFEYMALGLPILASDVGQLGRVLTDDRTAVLYNPSSHSSLVDGMRRLLADSELREQLGANAQLEFLSSHTWSRRMASLYCSLRELRVRAKTLG